MSFFKKIKKPLFWINAFKVALSFLLLLITLSLIINSYKSIFAADFKAVYQTHFADNKWIRFLGIKIVFSVIYGIWISNKKMQLP
ncbi:MAG: hypothetical protein ACK5H1_07115 [Tenacibaculum sp.]